MTTTESYDPIRYEAAFIIAERWREHLAHQALVLERELRLIDEHAVHIEDDGAVWGRHDAASG